jgi:hypothetical protein
MKRLFGPNGRSVSLPCNQHINSFPKQILNDANYPQYQHVHESGHLLSKCTTSTKKKTSIVLELYIYAQLIYIYIYMLN